MRRSRKGARALSATLPKRNKGRVMDDAWRERARQIKSQFEARDALTELFLTRKIVVVYSDEEERDRLNAERMREAKQQHDQIEKILEPCGSWDAGAIIHLIERLQYKAENMIADLRILGMTVDPESLRKHGIAEDAIDTVIAVHEHIRKTKEQEDQIARSEDMRDRVISRHEAEFEKALSDLTPLFRQFNAPATMMLDGKGKPIPRSQWGAETFYKYCEQEKAGHGRKMVRKVYKALSPTV